MKLFPLATDGQTLETQRETVNLHGIYDSETR